MERKNISELSKWMRYRLQVVLSNVKYNESYGLQWLLDNDNLCDIQNLRYGNT